MTLEVPVPERQALADARADLYTFLFTDIEGSTRLLQDLGDQAPAVIERHHTILRDVIAEHDGAVQRTEGDSFFATFDVPAAAVAAACELQRRLQSESWPMDDGLQIRIGLHTGEAVVVAQEFVGLDVNRAARIMSVGWGGQILVSDTTVRLLNDSSGISLDDLGAHRLKDLAEPIRLHQVLVPELRTEFPALKTLDAFVNNLPTQVTSFIGREREVSEVVALLDGTRVLTLTGPGGTGKTRLSLQVGAEVADRYRDGVFFVGLGGITDPTLVMSALADALKVSSAGTASPLELASDHLAERQALLVFDNFEQVRDAADDISKLLAAAPDVTVLVSSRAPLRISGEQEYPVPPLALPDEATLDVDALAASDAGALFATRAAAVRPGFQVTTDNATAVAAIIRRLDGLPLAIELAATRVKVLSVDAIAKRLVDSLGLLSSGARDVPERQRTLRGAIAWSHDLLEPGLQVLFARLSVFRGAVEFEHIEAICGPGLEVDVFDALCLLVDHSLVRRADEEDEARFFMLETIREFAAEQLEASDESAELRRRHIDVFLALAQSAEPHLLGPEGGTWLDHLEADHDNLRAALRRAIADGLTAEALLLVATLWRMWQVRGHLLEARRNLDAVVSLPDAGSHVSELAAAHEAGGGITYWQSDLEQSRLHYRAALDHYRELHDEAAVARGLSNLAYAYGPEDAAESVEVFEQALAAFTLVGDELGVARTHFGLAVACMELQDFPAMVAHTDACVPAFREAGQTFDLAWALHLRGLSGWVLGQHDLVRGFVVEALSAFRETNDATGLSLILSDFALIAESDGAMDRAARLHAAAEQIGEETGDGIRERTFNSIPRGQRAEDVLDETELAELRLSGRAMTRDEALAYALDG